MFNEANHDNNVPADKTMILSEAPRLTHGNAPAVHVRKLLACFGIVMSMSICLVSCRKVAQELGKKGSSNAAGLFLAKKVPTSARSGWKDLASKEIEQFATDYAARRASTQTPATGNSGNEMWSRRVDNELSAAVTEGRS